MMGDTKKEKAKSKVADSESNMEELIKKVITKIDDLSKKVDNNSKKCQDNFTLNEFTQGNITDKFAGLNKIPSLS